MPTVTSAGLLPYRISGDGLEVLIAHMGGPFWARKDERAWSVIKGQYEAATEEPLDAARREFGEETGLPVPSGELLQLGTVRQASGKTVTAWAVLAPDLDETAVLSNTFEAEWPPRSGRMQSFPEIDRAGWFSPDVARAKLVKAQAEFVDRLEAALAGRA